MSRMKDNELLFNRTILVQRLRKPFKNETASNPFSFGGGLKDGGLRPEAMEMLAPIWRFDYMGSAEFEFGEVPRALSRVAKSGDDPGLVSGQFEIKLSNVQPHHAEIPVGAKRETKAHWKTEGSATVWFMCPAGWEREVEARVRVWAERRYNSELKETTHLASALRPYHDFEKDGSQAVGWLEMNNGFLFFTDQEMWKSCCDLFGVTTP